MEFEQLHRLIDEKKWTLILRELDLLISKKDAGNDELILSAFEKMDRDFRERKAQKLYFEMWKIAHRSGKIKLAKSYAEFILDYLVELKRVPAIKKILAEFAAYGMLKNHKNIHAAEYILGKKDVSSLEEAEAFEFHPEMWKNSKESLKYFLLLEENWQLQHWKLAYEFILKFYYDKDLMLALTEKTFQLNKPNHQKKFMAFLQEKKVNTKRFEEKKPKASTVEKSDKLHADYDQLAMDVMSGAVEPSITEQRKILLSIEDLHDDELLSKGKDMIVAFGLLGMDKVVVRLSERVIPLMTNVKERISIQFMMAQALFNHAEYYKVSDMVDDITGSEPLLNDEILAFYYLKAESLLKLKKHKAAKDIFIKIKQQNPHYRLVGERLRSLEENK